MRNKFEVVAYTLSGARDAYQFNTVTAALSYAAERKAEGQGVLLVYVFGDGQLVAAFRNY